MQWSAAALAAAAPLFLPVVVLLFGRTRPIGANEQLAVHAVWVVPLSFLLA